MHSKKKNSNPNTKQKPCFGSLMVYNCVFNGAGRVERDARRYLWCDGAHIELVRKEAPGISIHPLCRFPAERDVRVGKPGYFPYYGFDMNLAPGPQGMWWMHYLIFLSLFTSLGRQLAAILQWLATLRSCRSLDFYKLCRFGTDHDWDKLQLPAKPVLLFDETHSWRVWELMCAPLTLGCVSAAGWWELLTSYLRMSDYRVKAYVCGCPTDKPCWK